MNGPEHAWSWLAAGAFVAVSAAAAVWLASLVGLRLELARVEGRLRRAVSLGVGLGVVGVAALVALEGVGAPVSLLGAVAAASVVALGFGARDVVASAVGGALVRVLRPFRAGDRVQLAGAEGVVLHAGWLVTVIEREDGARVSVLNGLLWAHPVVTFAGGAVRALEWEVPLPADVDAEKVRAAFLPILTRDLRIAADPAPSVEVAAGDDGTARLLVSAFSTEDDPSELHAAIADELRRVVQTLRAGGPG